jgi:hypothetical protein
MPVLNHSRKSNEYAFSKPTKRIEIIKEKYARRTSLSSWGMCRHEAAAYIDSASCVAGKYEVKYHDERVVCSVPALNLDVDVDGGRQDGSGNEAQKNTWCVLCVT